MSEPALAPSGEPYPGDTTVDASGFALPAWAWGILAPTLGALAGLLLGALLILLAGADPLAAYRTLLRGALGGSRQLTETVLKSIPLLIMGLGLTIAFRSRAWNIGGEGQFYMGALGGGLVAILFQGSWPAVVLIPAMLLAGIVGGALWAGLAAWMKVRRGINEIIGTLMLNYIAQYFLAYLARGPLKDPDSYLPQSAQLVGAARLPTLFGTRLHLGLIIAVLLVPATYLLIWKTPLGFRLRAIGSNQQVARYAGMNVPAGLALALLLSGGMAGLSGIIELSAIQTRLAGDISGNYGFTGILVALLGRLHPAGVVVSAFFFAVLSIGAQSMHSVNGLPIALAQVVQALVVLFVLAADALARYRRS